MAQLVAYKNPNAISRKQYPYLLDIQSDLLSDLRTTIVIPLCPESLAAELRISRLNPCLEIEGEKFLAMVQDISGVDRQDLGPEVCELAHFRAEIIAAFDFVLSGI